MSESRKTVRLKCDGCPELSIEPVGRQSKRFTCRAADAFIVTRSSEKSDDYSPDVPSWCPIAHTLSSLKDATPRPGAPLDVAELPDWWDAQRATQGEDASTCAAELRQALELSPVDRVLKALDRNIDRLAKIVCNKQEKNNE